MSIIVKGLNMPNRCSECPFRFVWCRERIYMDNRPNACPLKEQKKGKWLQTVKHYKDDEQEYNYIETTCSVCGVKKRIGWTGANYCPNCGAKMEVEE